MNHVKMRQCCREVASGRRVAGATTSLVNARGLQPKCARVLHESLLVPVLMHCSETLIRKEKERSRIDNLRGLTCIRRMDKVPNARIRVVRSEERLDEGVLR